MCRRSYKTVDNACLAAREAACTRERLQKHLRAESERVIQAINDAQKQLSSVIEPLNVPEVNNKVEKLRAQMESQASHIADAHHAHWRDSMRSIVAPPVMAAFPFFHGERLHALAAAIGQASGDILIIKAQLNEIIDAAHKPGPEFTTWVRTRALTVLGTMQSYADDALQGFVTPPVSDFLHLSVIITPTQTIFDNMIGYIRDGVTQFNSVLSHEDQVSADVRRIGWVR